MLENRENAKLSKSCNWTFFEDVIISGLEEEYHNKWAPTTLPECSKKVENLRKTRQITWFTARWLNPALLKMTLYYTYSDY